MFSLKVFFNILTLVSCVLVININYVWASQDSLTSNMCDNGLPLNYSYVLVNGHGSARKRSKSKAQALAKERAELDCQKNLGETAELVFETTRDNVSAQCNLNNAAVESLNIKDPNSPDLVNSSGERLIGCFLYTANHFENTFKVTESCKAEEPTCTRAWRISPWQCKSKATARTEVALEAYCMPIYDN